jgi:hypothetical protein
LSCGIHAPGGLAQQQSLSHLRRTEGIAQPQPWQGMVLGQGAQDGQIPRTQEGGRLPGSFDEGDIGLVQDK